MTHIVHRALRLLRLSLPLAAMEVPVAATVAIDTVLLGRVGRDAVAAGGLGAAVFLFIASICVSIVSSVGQEAAYQSGRKNKSRLASALSGGVAISWALGGAATGLALASAPLLRAIGLHPDLVNAASHYLAGVAPGFPLLLIAVCYRGMVSTQPGAMRLVGVAGASVASKAVLLGLAWGWMSKHRVSSDWVLVMCGASSSVTFLAMAGAAWLAHRRSTSRRELSPALDMTVVGARRVFRRGASIGLTTALQTGFFSLAAILCGMCGASDLAAHQVANQCTLLPLMLAFGMSQAVAMLTSQAVGASKTLEAGRTSLEAVYLGLAVMTMVAVLLVATGRLAISAILPESTPGRAHVAVIAWQLLIVGAICSLADGTQNVAMGALRGLGQGRLTIRSAIVAYWAVGIPLAWWLGIGRGWGAMGVWIGIGAGLHVSAALLLFFLYRILNAKTKRLDA